MSQHSTVSGLTVLLTGMQTQRMHSFFFFKGGGRNGKTVGLEVQTPFIIPRYLVLFAALFYLRVLIPLSLDQRSRGEGKRASGETQ